MVTICTKSCRIDEQMLPLSICRLKRCRNDAWPALRRNGAGRPGCFSLSWVLPKVSVRTDHFRSNRTSCYPLLEIFPAQSWPNNYTSSPWFLLLEMGAILGDLTSAYITIQFMISYDRKCKAKPWPIKQYRYHSRREKTYVAGIHYCAQSSLFTNERAWGCFSLRKVVCSIDPTSTAP